MAKNIAKDKAINGNMYFKPYFSSPLFTNPITKLEITFTAIKKITEKLYEQNLELAVKNKTLNLLEKLYHTSTQTLTPEEMAKSVTDVLRMDLNLEFALIYRLEGSKDLLSVLSFSGSDRFLQTIYNLDLLIDDFFVKNISQKTIFSKLLSDNIDNFVVNDISSIWKDPE